MPPIRFFLFSSFVFYFVFSLTSTELNGIGIAGLDLSVRSDGITLSNSADSTSQQKPDTAASSTIEDIKSEVLAEGGVEQYMDTSPELTGFRRIVGRKILSAIMGDRLGDLVSSFTSFVLLLQRITL